MLSFLFGAPCMADNAGVSHLNFNSDGQILNSCAQILNSDGRILNSGGKIFNSCGQVFNRAAKNLTGRVETGILPKTSEIKAKICLIYKHNRLFLKLKKMSSNSRKETIEKTKEL